MYAALLKWAAGVLAEPVAVIQPGPKGAQRPPPRPPQPPSGFG